MNSLEKATKLLDKRHTRLALTDESLFWFGRFYFSEYFKFPSPAFHKEMVKLMQFTGEHKYFLLEGFRESAKTVWAKIAMIQQICFKKRDFLLYVCFDRDKAKGHLYDIAVELQTNQKILADFGQLFYEDDLEGKKRMSQKKSMNEFITTNGVKVKAFSTGMSTRGEIYKGNRPQFYVIDDFENDKTKKSLVKTAQVKAFIDELLSGIASDANIIFLCNRISNTGAVEYIRTKAKLGGKYWKTMRIDLINQDGQLNWVSRYCFTNAEAEVRNEGKQQGDPMVVSVEERKNTLGTARFNQEYQNIPIPDDEAMIKREWVEKSFWTKLPSDDPMKKILMLDPQAGTSKTADYYGLSKVGFYPKDIHRYILMVKTGRDTQVNQAAMLVREFQADDEIYLVGVEKVLNQVAVYQLLIDWMAGTIDLPDVDNENRNLPLVDVSPEGRDKIARMQMHEPAFERGEIHLHHTMLHFADKLIAFPDVDHDDDIDSVCYGLEYSYMQHDFTKQTGTDYNEAVDDIETVGDIESEEF